MHLIQLRCIALGADAEYFSEIALKQLTTLDEQTLVRWWVKKSAWAGWGGPRRLLMFVNPNKTGNVRITLHWGAFTRPLLPWKSCKYYMFLCVRVRACSLTQHATRMRHIICGLWFHHIFRYYKRPQWGQSLFHADWRTNMTKPTLAFRNFANALKNG